MMSEKYVPLFTTAIPTAQKWTGAVYMRSCACTEVAGLHHLEFHCRHTLFTQS